MSAAPAIRPLVYTYAEAARLLACSTRTIERRVASGELQGVRVLGLPRVPASAIHALLGAQPQQASDRDAERWARQTLAGVR